MAGSWHGSGSWGVVVPVKRLTDAKSRLASYGGQGRRDLALAFAVDVVTACLATPGVVQVLVVTDDDQAAEVVRGLGAAVAVDPGTGLNGAMVLGGVLLREPCPELGIAAVAGDLPSLRADDLGRALSLVGARRAYVADADGTGTTLLAAGGGLALSPAFGAGSSGRHLASGAVALEVPAGLRRDVDTPADLGAALLLGVGPATAAAVLGL